jgi:hypothetical protein
MYISYYELIHLSIKQKWPETTSQYVIKNTLAKSFPATLLNYGKAVSLIYHGSACISFLNRKGMGHYVPLYRLP